MIDLYTWSTPNSRKVSIALEELGLPYIPSMPSRLPGVSTETSRDWQLERPRRQIHSDSAWRRRGERAIQPATRAACATLGEPGYEDSLIFREDSVAIHIPAKSLRTVLDAYPVLWRDVAFLALRRQRGLSKVIERRGHNRSLRICFCSRNALASPTRTGGSRSVNLAVVLNTSCQTVNRELGALARTGLVSKGYGTVVLEDLPCLRSFAYTVDPIHHDPG